jgi:hypothetical protein
MRRHKDLAVKSELKYYILEKNWKNGFTTFSSTGLRVEEISLLNSSL